MNYEHWEYEPETRTLLATDIEDGITLATVEPYDDADDIGRLIAAAPKMYELLKVWTQIGVQPTLMNTRKRAKELLDSIDGKETKGACD